MNYNVIFASILFITASVTPTCAQTKKSMEDERKETVPQYYYTEKEMDKVSAYIENQYAYTIKSSQSVGSIYTLSYAFLRAQPS